MIVSLLLPLLLLSQTVRANDATCTGGYTALSATSNTCISVKTLAATVKDAQTQCASENANLISIHDAETNAAVLQWALQLGVKENILIGLRYDNGPNSKWTDGSPLDFSHFATRFPCPSFGLAIEMEWKAQFEESGVAGFWRNVEDSASRPFVCARAKGEPDTITTTVTPTLAPPTCDRPIWREGNGTIYSPNYPLWYGSEALDCEYYITAQTGHVVHLRFTKFDTDPCCDFVTIYDGEDKVLGYLHGTANPTWYVTTQSLMKVTFTPNGGGGGKGWVAEYWSDSPDARTTQVPTTTITSLPVTHIPPNVCPTSVYSEETGTIYSPGYPLSYGPMLLCSYTIFSMKNVNKRVRLTFGAIDVELGPDIISVYDGPNSRARPLGRPLSGSHPAGSTYISSSSALTVVFSTDSNNPPGHTYTGWKATWQMVDPPTPPAYVCDYAWKYNNDDEKWYCLMQPADQAAASAKCKYMGGTLACPSTKEKNTFLTDYFSAMESGSMYYGFIGLTRDSVGGFQWADGSAYDFSAWAATPSTARCVAVETWEDPSANWRSFPCQNQLPFVCQV